MARPKAEKDISSFADLLADVGDTFKKTAPDMVYDPKRPVDFITSGNLIFDLVAGGGRQVGGWPRGRISEVFGMEHSGKTSLLYATASAAKKRGERIILFDFEHSFDPIFAKRAFDLEVDQDQFIIFQPKLIEEGDVIFEKVQKLQNIDVVLFDSVHAMQPKDLVEAALDEHKPALHARAMSRFVVKVKNFSQSKQCASIFTNQLRKNINMSKFEQNTGTGAGFNVMETDVTTGGNTLRFYASLRMKLEYGKQQVDETKGNMISQETERTRVGNVIKIINIKNKVGTPFMKGESYFDFVYPNQKGGWNESKDIMETLKKRGRLAQVGSTLKYKGLNIPEWKYTASKVECDKTFISDSALMKDAKDLLFHLIFEGKEDILDHVTLGELNPADLLGQEDTPEMVDFGSLTIVGEDNVDINPVSETTL